VATTVDLHELVRRLAGRTTGAEANVQSDVQTLLLYGGLNLAEKDLERLDVDVLNESLWRLAVEAESTLGLREAVAERYERLRSLLDERLGLEPAQETGHLHLRLLAQT
jgi:DNA-binding SARP family transcriptional activator